MRSSKPSSGTMKNAAPTLARITIGRGAEGRSPRCLRAGEAISGKGLAAVAEDVADEGAGERTVLRILELGDGIVGHHVERRRNGHALDPSTGSLDVREVDDAGVGFTERHLAEDGFHIDLLAGGLQGHAGVLQGLARIAPAWNH